MASLKNNAKISHIMKKTVISFILSLTTMIAFAQAKKPTIMVVPSDAWCVNNGYYIEYDNQGTVEKLPNYKEALQNNIELKLAIGKINDLMAERGFPLKDLEQTLASIEQRKAEDNMTMSKQGAELVANPVDELLNSAKADIIISLTWSVVKQGPKSTLTYIMEAKDPYTNKSIGGSNGTSQPSFSVEPVVLLEEAVLANIDNFNFRLQSHFDDLLTNGREVVVEVRVFENEEGIDLESEYEGLELSEIIDEWMEQNTVQGRFSKLDGSENLLRYEQVRIPLYKSNGAAMDTESFVRQLRNILRKEPYNLTTKIMNRGLGRTILVIGGK